MELNYSLYAFFETLALIQGVTLGTLLIIVNKRKYKSTFYLGLMLVLYSIQHLNPILEDIGLIEYHPFLYKLPINFLWLVGSLFYIYTQEVSMFGNKKIKYWLLYPGIISIFLQFGLFFFPYEIKVLVVQNIWYKIFFLTGFIFASTVIVLNLKLISKHKSEIENVFSMLESKELKWAKIYLIFILIGSTLYAYQYYLLPKNDYSKIFFILFDLIAIYWLSYHGIQQRNILSLCSKKALSAINFSRNQSDKNLLNPKTEDMSPIMDSLDQYMISSECFINPELTITDLSQALEIHPKSISSALNNVRNKNFNTYVNEFRIKKTILLLESSERKNLSIEGIGNEVGFNSKSAFYTAFKKETNTTPTKY